MRSRGYESKSNKQRAGIALRLLASTALIGLCSYTLHLSPAVAQTAPAGTTATRSFNIPAQPLAGALNAFGRQSGLQVTLAASTSRGVTSQAVSGSFTPQQALAQLLQGTGIPFSITSDRTALVGRQTSVDGSALSADGSLVLDTINVQGENPNSTMTLMAPYAGGQVATGGQLGMLGNRSVMNTPFSVTNYTKKTIEDQQARTLSEVLANEPSVVTSTGGVVDISSFRGFLSQTYTSGHSLNGLSNMAPMNSPNTDWVERVEVLRGPSALLKGAALAPQGPIGGSVNLVTKRAGDEPLTQVTTRYMSNSFNTLSAAPVRTGRPPVSVPSFL